MKHLISTLLSFMFVTVFLVSNAYSQGSHKPVSLGSSGAPYGYYEYLPKDFQKSGKKFPLLVFLHGSGEKGNGSNELDRAVKFGPGREINQGKHLPFVTLSPQTSGWWNVHELDAFIEHAVKNYNIDRDRIYLTGLSMGAMGIFQYAAKHAAKIAGIVAIAGSGNSNDVCNYSSVPLWTFHGDKDHVVPVTGSMNIVNTYNKCNPKPKLEAKLTILPGQKHWGWNEVYNGSKGDIYGWLQNHSKNGSQPSQPAPVANKAPFVNAGSDVTLTLPVASHTLAGQASDPDGKISSWAWSKVSGPAVTMEGQNTNRLNLKSLNEGSYTFKLTVKDDKGASASDEVKLTVKAAPVAPKKNQPPVANAGQDRVISLPVNEVKLGGSASDKDGKIVSFTWTKISGPSVDMLGANSVNLTLKNIKEGTYVFRFTAKDNDGASASDDMNLKVNPAPTKVEEKPAPKASVVAQAGSDKELVLPVSKVTLFGSAKWTNCSVRSYKWTKVQGPSVTMGGSATANLSLTQLVEGEYVFRFTATSQSGEVGSDDVKVVVKKGANSDKPKEDKPVVEAKPTPTPAPTPTPVPVSESVQGLEYAYYEFDSKKPWSKLPDLKNMQPKKRGTVSGFSLDPRGRSDYFAFAYEGLIKIDNSGAYAFYTFTDDGSKLYINDKLVVNNEAPGENVAYGWVDLSSGSHKIRVEYYENSGKERLYVSYKGPGVTLQAIPENKLSTRGSQTIVPVPTAKEPVAPSAKNGLRYSYYENKSASNKWYKLPDFSRLNPVKTGILASFSLSPAQTADHFAFVFEGKIKIDRSGDYAFYTNSDDGSQLFVNGKLVVNNDGWHAPQERSGKIRLSEGYHDIKVTYYEHAQGQVLDVKWNGPGIAKQVIPSGVLYLNEEATKASGTNTLASRKKSDIGGLAVTEVSNKEIRLYPNPASSLIKLELGAIEEEAVVISITDLTGREIYHTNFNAGAAEIFQLDLETIGIQNGSYIMMIENRNHELLKALRFIKE